MGGGGLEIQEPKRSTVKCACTEVRVETTSNHVPNAQLCERCVQM